MLDEELLIRVLHDTRRWSRWRETETRSRESNNEHFFIKSDYVSIHDDLDRSRILLNTHPKFKQFIEK